jgi:hypothetical protein
MSDSLSSESLRAADALSGAERDARVEHLLLQGLDHYFAGRYDTAVHVWTRVLFLDRGHARARAYIERARSAQAERQRESDELLHQGVAAFDRGDTGDAKELLTAAVSQGASPEVALSYLGRIDRLRPGWTATAGGASDRREPTRMVVAAAALVPPRTRRWTPLLALGTCVVVLAAWGAWTWFQVDDVSAALQAQPVAPAGPWRRLKNRCRCLVSRRWRSVARASSSLPGTPSMPCARWPSSSRVTRSRRTPAGFAPTSNAHCSPPPPLAPRGPQVSCRLPRAHEVPQVQLHRLRGDRPVPQLRVRVRARRRRAGSS